MDKELTVRFIQDGFHSTFGLSLPLKANFSVILIQLCLGQMQSNVFPIHSTWTDSQMSLLILTKIPLIARVEVLILVMVVVWFVFVYKGGTLMIEMHNGPPEWLHSVFKVFRFCQVLVPFVPIFLHMAQMTYLTKGTD